MRKRTKTSYVEEVSSADETPRADAPDESTDDDGKNGAEGRRTRKSKGEAKVKEGNELDEEKTKSKSRRGAKRKSDVKHQESDIDEEGSSADQTPRADAQDESADDDGKENGAEGRRTRKSKGDAKVKEGNELDEEKTKPKSRRGAKRKSDVKHQESDIDDSSGDEEEGASAEETPRTDVPGGGSTNDEAENKENTPKKKSSSTSKSKTNKKQRGGRKEPAEQPPADDEYEVQAIVGDRAIKGRVQYKVRWKGYESEDDTWENESSLDCNELIEEYNDSKGDDAKASKPSSSTSSAKPPASKKSRKRKNDEGQASGYTRDGPTENGEWEVQKILEVHTLKTGRREFLVRWKGYPPEDDSWEPEEHLKGMDILKKFLQKVEKAREMSEKELRISRKPTDRYTVMPQRSQRRGSKRFQNKQRYIIR